MAEKVGVVGALTVILRVVADAHCPIVGAKVYVAVPADAVLTAGDHVPVIELVDVVFNAGAVEPEQKGLITAKVGVTFGETVTEAE